MRLKMMSGLNEDEIRKYQKCYQDPSYRMGKRRLQWMQRDIDSLELGTTLLDVGAGRGETVTHARLRGLAAVGLDIVPELESEFIDTGDIGDLVGKFDVVTCYDVLEHIPPEELEEFLDNLFRLAKDKLFLTVSGNKSEKDGMELHLSVFPLIFWEDAFTKRTNKTILCQTYCSERDWHFAIY